MVNTRAQTKKLLMDATVSSSTTPPLPNLEIEEEEVELPPASPPFFYPDEDEEEQGRRTPEREVRNATGYTVDPDTGSLTFVDFYDHPDGGIIRPRNTHDSKHAPGDEEDHVAYEALKRADRAQRNEDVEEEEEDSDSDSSDSGCEAPNPVVELARLQKRKRKRNADDDDDDRHLRTPMRLFYDRLHAKPAAQRKAEAEMRVMRDRLRQSHASHSFNPPTPVKQARWPEVFYPMTGHVRPMTSETANHDININPTTPYTKFGNCLYDIISFDRDPESNTLRLNSPAAAAAASSSSSSSLEASAEGPTFPLLLFEQDVYDDLDPYNHFKLGTIPEGHPSEFWDPTRSFEGTLLRFSFQPKRRARMTSLHDLALRLNDTFHLIFLHLLNTRADIRALSKSATQQQQRKDKLKPLEDFKFCINMHSPSPKEIDATLATLLRRAQDRLRSAEVLATAASTLRRNIEHLRQPRHDAYLTDFTIDSIDADIKVLDALLYLYQDVAYHPGILHHAFRHLKKQITLHARLWHLSQSSKADRIIGCLNDFQDAVTALDGPVDSDDPLRLNRSHDELCELVHKELVKDCASDLPNPDREDSDSDSDDPDKKMKREQEVARALAEIIRTQDHAWVKDTIHLHGKYQQPDVQHIKIKSTCTLALTMTWLAELHPDQVLLYTPSAVITPPEEEEEPYRMLTFAAHKSLWLNAIFISSRIREQTPGGRGLAITLNDSYVYLPQPHNRNNHPLFQEDLWFHKSYAIFKSPYVTNPRKMMPSLHIRKEKTYRYDVFGGDEEFSYLRAPLDAAVFNSIKRTPHTEDCRPVKRMRLDLGDL